VKKQVVIGVDLGGTNVRVGSVKNNSIKQHYATRISSKKDEDYVLNEIFEAVEKVFNEEVTGIGCGVPSVVDVKKGIVYTVENIPSWKKVFLKDKLEKRFNVPAYINNDANAFALGESYFGKGRNYEDIVGLTIGTGMGAGIIINNKLYSGQNCGAGEFGMIPYKKHNFEYYCSGQFFKKNFNSGGDEIFARAQQGDKVAIAIFQDFGRELGQAIMAVLYSYDPQIIILGGSVSKSFIFYKDQIWEVLKAQYGYQHALKKLIIERSEQDELPVLGAAALCYDATVK
jgi:glucokinase